MGVSISQELFIFFNSITVRCAVCRFQKPSDTVGGKSYVLSERTSQHPKILPALTLPKVPAISLSDQVLGGLADLFFIILEETLISPYETYETY